MTLFDFLVIAKGALPSLSSIVIAFLLFVICMVILRAEKTINHMWKSQTFLLNSIMEILKLYKNAPGKSQEKPKVEEDLTKWIL